MKCFAFTLKHSTDYRYLSLKRVKGVAGSLYGHVLHQNVTMSVSSIMIYYHPPNTMEREGYTPSLFLTDVSRMFTMTYQKYHNLLLPPPFRTKCRDYRDIGHPFKADCVHECVITLSLEQFGNILPGPSLDNFTRYGSFKYFPVSKAMNDIDFLRSGQEIERQCDRKCWQPNCEESLYIPVLQAAVEYSYAIVATYVEQSPTMTTIYAPKISFIEFRTDFLSAFGFWLAMP